MRLWKSNSKHLDHNKAAIPGRWLFYLIALAGVLVSLFLWYAFLLQSNANIRHLIQLQADHTANDVRIQLELRISALKHMAKHLETDQTPSYNNWEDVVEYVDAYGGFKAIAWLNPAFQTHQISSNSNTKQFYLNTIKEYLGGLKDAEKQGSVFLSRPMQFVQDKQGMIMVVPLFNAHNQPLGYLASVLMLEDVLNAQLKQPDYAITIYDDDDLVFENRVNNLSTAFAPSVSNLGLYDTNWTIYVQPSARFISSIMSNLSSIALLLGICIAILFALTARLALLSRESAKTMTQINLDLKKEIADRLQAEESQQKLEKALQQGQKLQAIGTLAGGIAHDFNNILYAIIGYVEMAREDVAHDSLVYNNLGKVLQASHRGRDLISRILAFGRRQMHHEFKPIPLKFTIENVLGLLQPTIPASVNIKCETRISDDFQILGNQTQLHQIMVNLINNAVDAMDGEGTVSINISHVAPEDDLLRQFPQVKKGDYCKIDIGDTGYGMEQSTIERIFEPFFTTKEVGKGTGLGLATVHAITEEHRGKVVVKSQLGYGSTFTIFLPTHREIENGENSAG